MKKWFIFNWALFIFFSCANEKVDQPAESSPIEKSELDLVVAFDQLRIREAPGVNATVIGQLKEGTPLQDLGEVSSFLTRVKLRGTEYFTPWLKVKGPEKKEGWVYGGGVLPIDTTSIKRTTFLEDKLIQSIFGDRYRGELDRYRNCFHNMESATAIANCYQQGIGLRDTLVELLDKQIQALPVLDELPDFFWLQDYIPGFVPQLVAEGTSYYLFVDYKAWLEKVKNSPANTDDEFLTIFFQVYPEDSIEYFFPAWTIQTWDYGGHSLLGKNIHYRLLTQIDQALSKDKLFEEVYIQLKTSILEDIQQQVGGYWEPDSLIRTEIQQILEAQLPLLSATDSSMLVKRQVAFENPEKYNIEVNLRGGH